jgi:hypothetical protein
MIALSAQVRANARRRRLIVEVVRKAIHRASRGASFCISILCVFGHSTDWSLARPLLVGDGRAGHSAGPISGVSRLPSSTAIELAHHFSVFSDGSLCFAQAEVVYKHKFWSGENRRAKSA